MSFLIKLKQIIHQAGHRTFLLTPGKQDLSFDELLNFIERMQIQLQELGISRGSKVAIYVNSPDLYASSALVISSFATAVPFSINSTVGEIEELIRVCQIDFLIADSSLPPGLESPLKSLEIKKIVIASDESNHCGIFRVVEPVRRFRNLTKRPKLSGDVAFILQTSGTTAIPKLVPITHEAIVHTCIGSGSSLELTEKDRCLNFMPLTHVHGLISGLFLPLLSGASSVIAGQYKRKEFYNWLNDFKPTWFSATPAIYKDMIGGLSGKGEFRKHSLRFIRIGSAPLSSDFGYKLQKVFGVPLIEAYGMTETLQITGNPVNEPRIGSVGKSIAPEIAIMDESGKLCSPYEEGRIMVRGKTIFNNYLNDKPDATSNPDEWYFTGDRGWLDNDQYLYLSGRNEEFINKGGERIAPSSIEQAVCQFPGIDESLAFGVPHRTLDEDIAIAVTVSPGHELDEEGLKEYLYSVLSANKVPSHILAVNDFPRSESGKIKKQAIIRELTSTLGLEKVEIQKEEESAVEVWLSSLFARILNTEKPRRDQDFFLSGGTSLDAARLVAEVAHELKATIHIISFLRMSTVQKFAKFLIKNYPQNLKTYLSRDLIESLTVNDSELNQTHFDVFKWSLPSLNDKGWQPKNTKVDFSPVFILSAPRTGSTLLRVILGSHSQIFSPPELRLMQYVTLDQWKQNLSGLYTFYQEGLISAVMSAFRLDFQSAQKWINVRATEKVEIEMIYGELIRKIHPRIFVEKTPHYALDPVVLERLESSFDDPRYILLTRNPYDMVQSFYHNHMEQLWMHSDRFRPRHLGELIWSESYNNIKSFLETIPSNRKINLPFEDLVTTPKREIVKLCHFLGISFNEEMLYPQKHPVRTMTRGARQGSMMIGDTSFFDHKGIIASRAKSMFSIPEDCSLNNKTMVLARDFGYSQEGEHEVEESDITGSYNFKTVIEDQLKFLSGWKGKRLQSDSLVIGKNTRGKLLPLFWCFQGYEELDHLARRLGRKQPVYGMRSGHLLFGKNSGLTKELAGIYAKEMIKINKGNKFLIGGNCQGGTIAWEIAHYLKNKGFEVLLLFLMEVEILQSYPGRVALFYGENSEKHNPFLTREDPEKDWGDRYGSYTVDIIRGKHGKFFKERAHLEDLASKIELRIQEAMSLS